MTSAAPTTSALAVVPVRAGQLPAGGAEVVAEAGGRVIIIGEQPEDAADALTGVASDVRTCRAGAFAAGAWAAHLAAIVVEEPLVLLPASPDGRDLAPRLAAALEWPLFAAAMGLTRSHVTTIRHGGRVLAEHRLDGAAVVTLQPGVRGVEVTDSARPQPVGLDPVPDSSAVPDATVVDVSPPDVSTMDLSEAPRILGGGAGLDSARRFSQLAEVAASLDASTGATRVITDRGWVGHSRQIGTTGVVVDPDLYLAFGISGAVQHTAGLGNPDHIVSVNTEQHCPMMDLADLAIVADANATLDHLRAMLAGGAATRDASEGRVDA